jgi:putative endonuclease
MTLGNLGEDLAEKYLIENGYKIITQNYRNKIGEIDIIAYEKKVLVFIEVKTRVSTYSGFPYESVNYKKQKKIIKVAQRYIQEKNHSGKWRVDVVSVLVDKNGISPMP